MSKLVIFRNVELTQRTCIHSLYERLVAIKNGSNCYQYFEILNWF
uniref:Uncharacterized protein n=1 Tax=Anguilla anguilla TaxID=7936 RepID=A0A0E9PN71_ANGAN